MDLDETVQSSKKRDNYNYLFYYTDVSGVYSLLLQDFERSVKETTLNPPENEILYNIVTAIERGDRGKCHIVFPSLIFQNSEEEGNKPPKRRL